MLYWYMKELKHSRSCTTGAVVVGSTGLLSPQRQQPEGLLEWGLDREEAILFSCT